MHKDYFINLQNLIGQQKLENRNKASVIVVGLGGVGSWVAETLMRSGIGKITLVDLDDICVSNTNRQLHALQSTAGQSKVSVMSNRLKDINPEAEIIAIADFLTTENIAEIISPNSFVVDAIDSLKVKCALISYCSKQNIPIITTGGVAGKSNPEVILIKDLSETHDDPLLQRARKKLRMKFDFPKKKKQKFGIMAVFSPEKMDTTHSPKVEAADMHCDVDHLNTNCSNGIGTCVTVTATFGIRTCHQILNLIDATL